MSHPVEQALLSLLPTHGTDLPPALVELAESLLAQSRHRASTLKADEEVARYYACANLACERLKIALDLPPIEPRPPIPPRIYARLYAHLANILPNQVGTPRSARQTPRRAAEHQPCLSRPSPTKEASLAPFRTQTLSKTSASHTPTRSSTRRRDARDVVDSAAPTIFVSFRWLPLVARFVCREMDHAEAIPSVLAAIEHVFTLSDDDAWLVTHAAATVAALVFFVVMRFSALRSGNPSSADAAMDRAKYVPLRKDILAQMARARAEIQAEEESGDHLWHSWNNPTTRDFDAAVARVNEKDWLAADWYRGIDDVAHVAQRSRNGTNDQDSHHQGPARRADMMFQDKYDLLSEKRRADYKTWKRDMLSRIDRTLKATS